MKARPGSGPGLTPRCAAAPARTVGAMTRIAPAFLAIALLLVAAACGSTSPREVPDVTGKRLDVAEDTLDSAGLHYRTAGGGTFGVVVRSRWIVCEQSPRPHTVATSVLLTVARTCTPPLVVGETLAAAREELDDAGFDVRAHDLDGEWLYDDSYYVVCSQTSAPGIPVRAVDLYVAPECRWHPL